MKFFLIFSGLLYLSSISHAAAENKTWPTQLINRTQPKIIAPKETSPPYTYTTKSFRFITQRKIDLTKMAHLAMTAESVPAAINRIPLPLQGMPVRKDGSKPPIYIIDNEDRYEELGGAKVSAGFYSGSRKAIYLRASSFIDVKPGRLPSYNLLVHELVHLSNHGVIGYVSAWLSEGTAEYFSAAFVPKGSYKFNDMPRRIKSHVERYTGRRNSMKLLPLDQLMTLNSARWRELTKREEEENSYRLYYTSLLLTHYFYHLDKDGRDKVETYIKASKKRKKTTSPYPKIVPDSELAIIEKRLVTYWKSRGLSIYFAP